MQARMCSFILCREVSASFEFKKKEEKFFLFSELWTSEAFVALDLRALNLVHFGALIDLVFSDIVEAKPHVHVTTTIFYVLSYIC